MLLSAVSVLVVAQSSSEIPEGLMNNPVYINNGGYTDKVIIRMMAMVMMITVYICKSRSICKRKAGFMIDVLKQDS